MLPPGDVRTVALSEDEHLLSQLFQFRFTRAIWTATASATFVAALSHITETARAVQRSSQISPPEAASSLPPTLTSPHCLRDDGSPSKARPASPPAKRTSLIPTPPPQSPETPAPSPKDFITLGPGSSTSSSSLNLVHAPRGHRRIQSHPRLRLQPHDLANESTPMAAQH